MVVIVASMRRMSWMSRERAALVATRLSMVAFFWMEALARLSSEVAICCACSISVAWLAPKVESPVVMQEISRISANAAVQWIFQFAHVCSFAGRRFHSLQLSVMLPLEIACFDPVVTMSSSEIGTPASATKTLALLLLARVDGQWEAGVDADVELGHVVVQVGLADLGVRGQYVLDQRAEIDAVESFHRIIEDGVVDVVDGGGKLVPSDGKDEAVGSPCFLRGDVDGA